MLLDTELRQQPSEVSLMMAILGGVFGRPEPLHSVCHPFEHGRGVAPPRGGIDTAVGQAPSLTRHRLGGDASILAPGLLGRNGLEVPNHALPRSFIEKATPSTRPARGRGRNPPASLA